MNNLLHFQAGLVGKLLGELLVIVKLTQIELVLLGHVEGTCFFFYFKLVRCLDMWREPVFFLISDSFAARGEQFPFITARVCAITGLLAFNCLVDKSIIICEK
jgi:hypothetical protein